jgi:glucosamine 6-phosphate synthetase-like amidotransferase/phosphosugar isomerase protein
MSCSRKSGSASAVRATIGTRPLAPLLTILPLQFLSCHVPDLRGTDVDQPRKLAREGREAAA